MVESSSLGFSELIPFFPVMGAEGGAPLYPCFLSSFRASAAEAAASGSESFAFFLGGAEPPFFFFFRLRARGRMREERGMVEEC